MFLAALPLFFTTVLSGIVTDTLNESTTTQPIIEPIIDRIPFRPAWERPNSNFQKMGLFFCQIPKSGTTIMKIVLCDLYRYFKGIPFKLQLSHDKVLSDCARVDWFKDFKSSKDNWQPRGQETKIVLIRHPIDRFVSLYGYLCERLQFCGAQPDIQKFSKDVYTLLKTRSVNGTAFDWRNRELLEYHAQPQIWFCKLAENIKQFHLIHQKSDRISMRNELQAAFDEAKVPKVYADRVLAHIVYSETAHANHDENHMKNLRSSLETNPQTIAYLNAIYYQDFEILNY